MKTHKEEARSMKKMAKTLKERELRGKWWSSDKSSKS
jgi:hypothetical protein